MIAGSSTDSMTVRCMRGRQPLGQRGLHHRGLAHHHVDIYVRGPDDTGQLAAGQAQELIEIGLALGTVPALAAFGERALDIGGRCRPQLLLELGDAHGQRRHGIADVVQHAARELGHAGLETVVDQLASRLGDLADHAVELLRQRADLIAALEIQARRQVIAGADRGRVLRDLRQRREHRAVEQRTA